MFADSNKYNESNEIFRIVVEDKFADVDAKLMMEISGLFMKQIINLRNKISTSNDNVYILKFENIRYQGDLLWDFFKICQGKSADIKLSDIYYLSLIAEEWECPIILQQLLFLLESKADPRDILSRFSRQPDIFPFLIDIIASKFRLIFENSESKEKIKDLDPKYICKIIQSPKCEFPRRDYFDEFIIDLITKHRERCSSLIKYIDLLNTDLQNLKNLNALLTSIRISPMYPNVSRILHLRECECECNLLKTQNNNLRRENANLKNEVQLLEKIHEAK